MNSDGLQWGTWTAKAAAGAALYDGGWDMLDRRHMHWIRTRTRTALTGDAGA